MTPMYEPPHSAPPPPPPPAPPRPPLPPRGDWNRSAIAMLAAILVAMAGIVGYTMGHRDDGVVQQPTDFTFPRNSAASDVDIEARQIANRLDDSIVNITTRLSSGGAAAGTGIVISSDGLVLTNNHVIADTTELRVENSATGDIESAKVLGYDVTADVALIRIQDASGLKAAPIGDASALSIGDAVVGLGNAGGDGGSPSISPGRVTALDQRIVASDTDGTEETLEGLIQVDAGIQPGDSGGPLADADGRVVGIDVAASRNDPRFAFSGNSGEAYAIPIQQALTVAKRITSGQGGDGIHIGATRGVMGVGVGTRDVEGAYVSQVQSDSPADDAGITRGSVIVAIDGRRVASSSDLTRVMAGYSADDEVRVTWTDASGDTFRATLELDSAPPA